MKVYKYQAILILALTLFFGIGWQKNCDSPKNKNSANNTKMEKDPNFKKGISDGNVPDKLEPVAEADLKTISEGGFSNVETPFVFVANSVETYKQLQNLVENLPSANTIDFTNSAVIAAFAGERNTGGYSVIYEGANGKFSVSVKSPPKGGMVTQVISTPYKIVVAPVNAETQNVTLNLSENWTKTAQTYKITAGEIEFSGGIAGIQEKYKPEGSITIYQLGEFATLFFDLQGKTANKNFQTKDVASGKIKNGNINLPTFEAANLIEKPHPSFSVSGTISGEKLSLKLKKSDEEFNVSDGFQGSGKIEAAKIK